MRKLRKKEHVENYLRTMHQGDTLMDDVFLPNNSLPDLNFEDIDTSTTFLGKKIDAPIMINAMTGGSEFTQTINEDLARLAKEFNIPIAVGSQTIALCKEDECMESFRIVREIVGDGVVISNLNAAASLEDCREALELVNGDGLQLHINPAHEMVMAEGDRDFKGILSNIEELSREIDRPVIIKEVGLGMSEEVVEKLYDAGIRSVDISGSGGTNFIEIENLRNMDMDYSELYSWGIPTALSIVEARKISEDLLIIGSGGIRNSLDVAKALVLGADMVGIAGELISFLLHGGYDRAYEYLEETIYKLKIIMMLLGRENIEGLKTVDYRVTGRLKELLD